VCDCGEIKEVNELENLDVKLIRGKPLIFKDWRKP
jgi:hypothetical protein